MALRNDGDKLRSHESGVRPVFVPAQRAAEKQASRDADARALKSGLTTVQSLRQENSFTAPLKHARIDYTRVPKVRIR